MQKKRKNPSAIFPPLANRSCEPVLLMLGTEKSGEEDLCHLMLRGSLTARRGSLYVLRDHGQRHVAGPLVVSLPFYVFGGFLWLLLPLQGSVLLCCCLEPFHRQKIRMNLALQKAVKMLRGASWPLDTVQ